MIFCIPKNIVDTFVGKLKSGEIDPMKLSEMTSVERNAYFSSFMGELNAKKVNALFESKLLLKDQQRGIITWAKQVSGIKPAVKRDMLTKVQKMTTILQPKDLDSFLADLAAQRLGIGVTMEEAGKISDLAKTVSDKKSLVPKDSPKGSPERLEYGTALTIFKNYIGELKSDAKKLSLKELLTSPGDLLQELGGVTKSIAASFDNSFFGRQGIITLINNPKIWGENFVKSWGDMAKELKGIDAMLPIKADIFSRPNALNGKYRGIGLDIGLESEEAFPSQLPEKIPFFGRIYKASESAYNGAALRFRADLADTIIKEAEDMGVNVMDKEAGIGRLINSMTGRGSVQLTQGQSKFINTTIFSIKYLKSNFDVLTAHAFDKKVGAFARKKAANNIMRVIGVMAGLLGTAKMLDPDSVELDPRSSNFGKILVGKNREIKINVTAGMGSIITLASRITPTIHKGKWGFWLKTSKGRYIRLGTGKYGVSDASDIIFDFMKDKASPIARTLLDVWQGSTFGGGKLTAKGKITELATPIPVQNLFDLAKTSANADALLYTLLTALDLLGVNVSTSKRMKKTYN